METSARDRHLFGQGPKRILALDGGGIRGIITIAFLERLEQLLDSATGKAVRLCDWFDLVGGTSTGAIIATAVALGFRAAEIKSFYEELAPEIFRKHRWRLVGRQSVFESKLLRQKLVAIIGNRTLDSEDLQTGLCIVTKRLDRGSSWILINNPRSIYWETPPDKSFIGNKHFLSSVSSAAAPHFFDPEMIQIAEGMVPALFVDGGVSPHNNPSLYMFMSATLPSLQINWSMGPDRLTIVSIGTGSSRPTITASELPWLRSFGVALHALKGQISDAEELVLALMSWLGESPTRWKINSELGDLGLALPPFNHPLFRFLRYDIRLEGEWLRAELNRAFDARTVAALRDLADARNLTILHELGVQAAQQQMTPEHFALGGKEVR
jgi:hypothetical protein